MSFQKKAEFSIFNKRNSKISFFLQKNNKPPKKSSMESLMDPLRDDKSTFTM